MARSYQQPNEVGYKPKTFYCPTDLWDHLMRVAEREDRSASYLVTRCLEALAPFDFTPPAELEKMKKR